jgi:hypothetical protein
MLAAAFDEIPIIRAGKSSMGESNYEDMGVGI